MRVVVILFLFGCCHSASVVYRQELSSEKRLTRKHTFLDQLCLPDDFSDTPVGSILIKVVATMKPTYLETDRKYLDTATGVKVAYKENVILKLNIWAELYDGKMSLGVYTMQNNTFARLLPEIGRPDCIDIRYAMPFVHDERLVTVKASYSMDVYWINEE